MTDVIYGVDVHPEYQHGLSEIALKREGFAFSVVKATEGVGYTAPGFASWILAARAAGLIPGAYHYLRTGDGAAQCRYFLDRLRAVGGPEGLLIQLDVESDGRVREIEDWLDEWARQGHGGHPVLIYSGSWWWGPNVGGYAPARRGVPRCLSWHSSYVSGSGYASALHEQVQPAHWVPGYGGWGEATILQFSSKGTAGGLTANVDVNAFRGTLDQLRALARSDHALPAPPEDDVSADDVWKTIFRQGADEHSDHPPVNSAHAVLSVYDWLKNDHPAELLEGAQLAARVDQIDAKVQSALNGLADLADMLRGLQLGGVDVAQLAQLVGEQAEGAAERAVRRVLGETDGASPASPASSATPPIDQ